MAPSFLKPCLGAILVILCTVVVSHLASVLMPYHDVKEQREVDLGFVVADTTAAIQYDLDEDVEEKQTQGKAAKDVSHQPTDNAQDPARGSGADVAEPGRPAALKNRGPPADVPGCDDPKDERSLRGLVGVVKGMLFRRASSTDKCPREKGVAQVT